MVVDGDVGVLQKAPGLGFSVAFAEIGGGVTEQYYRLLPGSRLIDLGTDKGQMVAVQIVG